VTGVGRPQGSATGGKACEPKVFGRSSLQEKLEILSAVQRSHLDRPGQPNLSCVHGVFGFAGRSRSPHISGLSQLEKYLVAAVPAQPCRVHSNRNQAPLGPSIGFQQTCRRCVARFTHSECSHAAARKLRYRPAAQRYRAGSHTRHHCPGSLDPSDARQNAGSCANPHALGRWIVMAKI
jgi:hypothetical protein